MGESKVIGCVFCGATEYVLESKLAYARYDKYPVSPGHLLIIPKRHVQSYFDVTNDERTAMFELLEQAKDMVTEERSPDGFNIGVNVNETAGQTVMHVHMHLIPRYAGDQEDPRGGVRGVIPEKQKY